MSLVQHDLLYRAVFTRHSVRTYDRVPLHPEDRRVIQETCDTPRAFGRGARVVLLETGAERVFAGPIVRGVPAFLAMVGDGAEPHVEEALGYLGEYVILTATALGLGTCWVGGTYRSGEAAKMLGLGPTERLYAVSPLGYGGEVGLVEKFLKMAARSASRKPLTALLTAASLPLAAGPPWAGSALEAARLAPSAVNRQPWRFTIRPDSVTVSVGAAGSEARSVAKRLDCGIALLHLELGALAAGVSGGWRLLETPDVAVYTVLEAK